MIDRLKLLPPGTKLKDVPANWEGLTWKEWEQVRLIDICVEAEKARVESRKKLRLLPKAKPVAEECDEGFEFNSGETL
jgi:hypothetical protein